MPGFHPSAHARTKPDHPALVIADTGEQLTYRQLDERSNRVAQLLRSRGLNPGDKIAVMLPNCLDFPAVYWGATRSGLIVTLLSTHLKPDEAGYIIRDSGALALVADPALGATPQALIAEREQLIPAIRDIWVTSGDPLGGAESLAEALA